MLNQDSDRLSGAAGQFPATHWSLVRAAGGEDTRAQQALASLCETYWYPLYAYVRRHGHTPEEAQDTTQAFIVHLLEHHTLAAADRAKGKFRSFLLVSLQNFLANELARARTQKRGGGCVFVPLDPAASETRYTLEPADPASPEKLFELHYVQALLERVLARLQAKEAAAGKGAQFEILRGSLMADPDAPACARLAAELGVSEDTVRMRVHRLRRRYRELLREEIAQTVGGPAEIEEEIRHLFAVLAD